MTVPPLHFVVPVWGDSYVRTYLDYSLPAQLASNNIPALRDEGNIYIIYTTSRDLVQLEASPAYRALKRMIPVWVECDAFTGGVDKYRVKTECYRRTLRDAARDDAAVVMLNADIVLANGFIRSAIELLDTGKRVIEVLGPRGQMASIGKVLIKRRAADGSISINPADLAALWLKHQHPLMAMHYVEGPLGGPFQPSHLYWPVGDEGVIVRAFHLYPIVVWPHGAVEFRGTIDDDLVAGLGLFAEERYIAQDSREMFCCELSAPDHHVGQTCGRGDIVRHIEFYKSYVGANFDNLRHVIVVTGVSHLGPQWMARSGDSAWFVEKLAGLL